MKQVPVLKEFYLKQIVPSFMKEHGFENIAAEEKFYDKIVDFFNRHP